MILPAPEETFTILGTPSLFFKRGANASTTNSGPVAFVRKHISSCSDIVPEGMATAALLTKASRRPYLSETNLAASVMDLSEVTSMCKSSTVPRDGVLLWRIFRSWTALEPFSIERLPRRMWLFGEAERSWEQSSWPMPPFPGVVCLVDVWMIWVEDGVHTACN